MLISSLLWGVSLFAIVFLSFSLLQGQIWDPAVISLAISAWKLDSMNTAFLVSMMVLGNAFLEEFFWRGYIVHKLSSFCGKKL